MNALTLASGSGLSFEFNGSANDFINVTGTNGLTINGGALGLFQEGTTNPLTTPGTYVLMSYSGNVAGSVDNVAVQNPAPNYSYTLSNDTAGQHIVLTVLTPFQVWQRAVFTAAELNDSNISGALADPNGNGLPNLLEYAFHLDPKASTTGNRPTVACDATYVSLTYTQNLAASDLVYTVEQSIDLVQWDAAAAVYQTAAGNGVQTVMASVPRNGATKLFLRLRVTQQ
jgi:hypothetical protein